MTARSKTSGKEIGDTGGNRPRGDVSGLAGPGESGGPAGVEKSGGTGMTHERDGTGAPEGMTPTDLQQSPEDLVDEWTEE